LDALPEAEAEKLKRSRWAIINLWRPLNVVTRDNLALCDARTAEESELVPVYAELIEKLKNAKTGYNFSQKELWRRSRSRLQLFPEHIRGTMPRT
jgi:hypothetical protein